MLLLKSSTTVYVHVVPVASETWEPSLEITKKELYHIQHFYIIDKDTKAYF